MLKYFIKNRIAVILTGLIVLILAASIAAFLYLNNSEQTGTVAEIYQDGTLIETIHLDTVTEDYSFTVRGTDDTIYNVIEVHHGEIGIAEASCPDGLCIHMGFIHSSAMPITCLPNKLVIKIVTEGNSTDAVDGVAY
jgi:hypothetical protein